MAVGAESWVHTEPGGEQDLTDTRRAGAGIFGWKLTWVPLAEVSKNTW